MIEKLFGYFRWMECLSRWLLFRFPQIKMWIKKERKTKNINRKQEFDKDGWKKYQSKMNEVIENGDIVLVHASMDGLNNIGVGAKEVLDFLQTLIERRCTIVSTAYPITNLNIRDHKMKTYDPQKTPCWTGMLSNYFLSLPDVVRSSVPYNSLAAVGPQAKEMMKNNDKAEYVYGENTPWKYCIDHHAKVLFVGTTNNDANTIQTHMIADVMKDKWPIDNWYDEIECPVKLNEKVINKKLYIQNEFWTQYVTDYYITRRIKSQGLLCEYCIEGCPFGYIADAYVLVKYLISECGKGKIMYMIPKKYWKKKKGKKCNGKNIRNS